MVFPRFSASFHGFSLSPARLLARQEDTDTSKQTSRAREIEQERERERVFDFHGFSNRPMT